MRKLSYLSPAEISCLCISKDYIHVGKYNLHPIDINPWKNQRKKCLDMLKK